MEERCQKLLTFLNIAFVDDLSTSLARLLNHESCAHTLVVATQTLTRLVPHLRHDLRRHCVAEEDKIEYDFTHTVVCKYSYMFSKPVEGSRTGFSSRMH